MNYREQINDILDEQQPKVNKILIYLDEITDAIMDAEEFLIKNGIGFPSSIFIQDEKQVIFMHWDGYSGKKLKDFRIILEVDNYKKPFGEWQIQTRIKYFPYIGQLVKKVVSDLSIEAFDVDQIPMTSKKK